MRQGSNVGKSYSAELYGQTAAELALALYSMKASTNVPFERAVMAGHIALVYSNELAQPGLERYSGAPKVDPPLVETETAISE